MPSALSGGTWFKPFVFIASSGLPSARDTAERLSGLLSGFSEPKPWWSDVFLPGYLTLQSLWKAVQENDFAVFLFTPEAEAEIREQRVQIGNLNVLFEFGLFLGHLGPERVLLLVPAGGNLHLPNDLDALTRIEYEEDDLEVASRQIEGHIRRFLSRDVLTALDVFNASESRRHRNAQFKEQPKTRIELLSRKVLIQANGDAEIEDTLTGLSAMERPIDGFPLEIRSSAGRPADPVFEVVSPPHAGQTITWRWNDKTARGPVYQGRADFRPPLLRNNPITVLRRYLVHNAFVWTVQDRLINTGYKQTYEREFIELASVVESLILRVSFPEDRFPEHVNVVAGRELDDKNIEDLFETERIRKGLKSDRQARTVTLFIHLPLAGYRYEVRWSLPRVDNTVPDFSPRVEGLVEEVNRRLLAKANLSDDSYQQLRNSLLAVRKRVASALGEPDEALDCGLFVYDRRAGGLRCAGSLLSGEPNHGIMQALFRPGQGLAGRVFRSRSPLPYRSVPGMKDVNVQVCEPVDGKVPDGSILCLPLFLPEEQSRCVGVLSIDDPGGSSRLTREIEDSSIHGQLKRIACEWYVSYFTEITRSASSTYWRRGPKAASARPTGPRDKARRRGAGG